ncbi:MAG: choice-of-anchor Q domain-containing protein, partial [Myxococcota bacterium]
MRITFLSVLVVALVPNVADAATLFVTDGGDSGPGTLRQTVSDAMSGDTIAFDGVDTVSITGGDLNIVGKALIIDGGEGVHITRSAGTGRLLDIRAGAGQSFELRNLDFSNGSTNENGGAIEFGVDGSDGIGIIHNCSFFDNEATGSSAEGGAVDFQGRTLRVELSLFYDNSSGFDGGGIYVDPDTNDFTILNSTFLRNTAERNGGGALLCAFGGTGLISHSSFVGNISTGGNGGGLNVPGCDQIVTFRANLVALNTAGGSGADISGSVDSDGFNFIGGDPGIALVSVVDRTRPAYTFNFNSPLIDAGTCTDTNAEQVAADQRGIPRPLFGDCDIGSIEYSAPLEGQLNAAVEPPGVNCSTGGLRIDIYNDYDENGQLTPTDPITDTQFICNGADGS